MFQNIPISQIKNDTNLSNSFLHVELKKLSLNCNIYNGEFCLDSFNFYLINKNNNTDFIMTYSYGRALQQSALKLWSKDIKNIKETQKVFNHRAKMNTLAAQGKWSIELENK